MIKLKESRSLSKGIFWMICGDGITNCSLISVPVYCDLDGNNDLLQKIEMNSKDGNSVTHKNTWPLIIKENKSLRSYEWNFFPKRQSGYIKKSSKGIS